MDIKKFEIYRSNVNINKNNINKNIFVLEEQINDLKSKLEYQELMFTLIENIFNILSDKCKEDSIILLPLKLKEYFKNIFSSKKDIYTYLHDNLIMSGIHDFDIENHNQYRIRVCNDEMLDVIDEYFDTYLSVYL